MQLTIYKSNITSGAINQAIMQLGRQNEPDTEHIVIVPDRFTLSQEQQIYQQLHLDGSFNIDVMSFSRLASKMVKNQQKHLSKEGTVMLMRKVLKENIDKLSYFGQVNISYGFAREVFAVIAALKDSGITPQMLIENADTHRKDKFQDLATIYSLYEKELKKGFSDSLSRYEQLLEIIKIDNTISQVYYYVLGFNIFSETQYKIIQELCLHSLGVTIAVATDSQGANKEIFTNHQIEELATFAKDNNIKYDSNYVFCRLNPPFDTVNKELFAFTKVDSATVMNREAVCLVKQKNAYEELRVVAREINHLVKNNIRYKDIAVVCCQEEYRKCISSTFKRFDIPFFIDERYQALYSIDAKFIFFILEVVISRYRTDNVINLIKHPYFNLCINDIHAFENYCLKYNINHSVFLKPLTIGEDCQRFEIIRRKLMSLMGKLKIDGNASKLTQSLIELLKENAFEGDESKDILFNASVQIRDRVIALLEEVEQMLGAEQVNLEEYYNILREGIGSLESALIPQYIDCVFVGDTSESRFNNIRYLFVVGANEGFFPHKTGEQTILTYGDILYLKKNNLILHPNPIDVNRREKFVINDLISQSEKLYISCSDYSITGEAMQLGEVMKELSYILGLRIEEEIPHHNFSEQQRLLYYLGNLKNAYHEFIANRVPSQYHKVVKDLLIKEGYAVNREKPNEKEFDFAKYLFLIGKSGNYTTKVSQLESYSRCPYSHYLSYGLKLKEREIADLRVVDIGNIIHEVLEVFFRNNLERIKQLEDTQIYQESKKAIDFVFDKISQDIGKVDAINLNRLNRVRDECFYVIQALIEKIKMSSFVPKYIELVFEENSQFSSAKMETSKGLFELRGKIDRVDVYNKKAVIIDYKTGSVENAKLKYVYCGKKIQPYVYMSIFTSKGYHPAGAFFLPIKDGYKSTKERFRLVGQVENDIDTIRELDNLLLDEKRHDGSTIESEVLSITAKLKKEGISPNKSNYLINYNDFMNIISYVKVLIKTVIEEVSIGYIKKSPIEGACKYCPYKSHCDALKVVERKIDAVKIKDFDISGADNGMD